MDMLPEVQPGRYPYSLLFVCLWESKTKNTYSLRRGHIYTSSVPGLNPSTTTLYLVEKASFLRRASPSCEPKSSANERLPRLTHAKYEPKRSPRSVGNYMYDKRHLRQRGTHPLQMDRRVVRNLLSSVLSIRSNGKKYWKEKRPKRI